MIKRYPGLSIEEKFEKYVERAEGCWKWHGSTDGKFGYGRIYSGRHKYIYAHRLSYQLVHGEFAPGLEVLHHCDNANCCNPEHLYAGTHQDNMRDMKERKRYVIPHVKGEQCGQAKLTENDVLEMRKLHSQGFNCRQLSQRFGISRQAANKIILRQRWMHI